MKWISLAAVTILMGCQGEPARHIYILSPPADGATRQIDHDTRPVLELRTVSLPDYLDTSDILLRDGRNELRVSPTGRWGERLSTGIAEALRNYLARRLPKLRIVGSPEPGQPNRSLMIDVEAFDVQADGHCILTARWTILDVDRQAPANSGRATIVTPASASTDAAVTAAMETAIEQLADRITVTLNGPR
jgi:uncharacterized protein